MSEVEEYEQEQIVDEELELEGIEELQLEENAMGNDAANEEANEDAQIGATAGSFDEINTTTFVELHLDPDIMQATRDAWNAFLKSQANQQAACDAIYNAFFESAPSLQHLFVTPKSVQAMKFYNLFPAMMAVLDQPAKLKEVVEAQGFGHMSIDVTAPRVVVFRDALLDLFQVELGEQFGSRAVKGWKAALNYFGGAVIYTKATFAERLGLLGSSWKLATAGENEKETNAAKGGKNTAAGKKQKEEKGKKKKKHQGEGEGDEEAEGDKKGGKGNQGTQNIPTTFNEMFLFNAAVMGYSGSIEWMNEVLLCFHNIVTNVSNVNRFQEECDFLMLRITKATASKVNLGEFKACMLASLRSCLPKAWTMPHEVAWSWMWENVEKLILKYYGLPPKWEKALVKFVTSLDEATAFNIRKDIYESFFVLCPPGQYLFKQSDAYLHIIAQKVLVLTMDLYRTPIQVVDDISALGLRHVGYGIDSNFFSPFASACMDVIRLNCSDEVALESYRWSISLVAKSMVRTLVEGLTAIMKAINFNTESAIVKALHTSPRCERSQWMLMVQVGTQNVSPMAWALESGSLNSARAILQDLLVIRADRDNYYYGMTELFTRHTDIVKKLGDDAPQLLPVLFDGLLWRSHMSISGTRRVNYYVKYLLVTLDNKFAKTLEWIGEKANPKIVVHPVLAICADLVWRRLAYRRFLVKKSWTFVTLLLFLASQSIMFQHNRGRKSEDMGKLGEGIYSERLVLLILRVSLYLFAMLPLVYQHVKKIVRSYSRKTVVKVFGGRLHIPEYLNAVMERVSLSLGWSLIIMFFNEPIIYCSIAGEDMGTAECSQFDSFNYSIWSMIGMCLYFLSLTDLVVFVTTVCAFFIAVQRLISEVALFLVGLGFTVISFGCAINCLHQAIDDFHGPPEAVFTFLKVFLRMYNFTEFGLLSSEGFVLIGVFLFMAVAFIFLFNLLIAQLCCAYDNIYHDMVGMARLNRVDTLVETVPQISQLRWDRFVTSLDMDSKLEFNAGDIGLPGGIQVLEAANANPTNKCTVVRYGGSTSLTIPWPVTDDEDADQDKFERLEKVITKALAQVSNKKSAVAGMNSSMGAGSSGVAGAGSGASGGSNVSE